MIQDNIKQIHGVWKFELCTVRSEAEGQEPRGITEEDKYSTDSGPRSQLPLWLGFSSLDDF